MSTFDVNVRSTYASLQFGREGLAKFCGTMDLPAPILNTSYSKILKKVGEKSKEAAETVMKETAERIIQYTMEVDPESIDVKADGTQIGSVAVSLDGTWQKRGHSSKHGVVFLIAVDTGEVLLS